MMSPGPGAYRISKDMKQSKSGFSLGLGRQVEYILIKDIIYNINKGYYIYYWNIIEILIKDIILILIKDIILILIKDIILISKY